MQDREEILKRINESLEKIRPYLVADGGNITLEEVTDDLVVKVKLHGACQGCPFSVQTLKSGVERALRRDVPEIKELVPVN